jgi:hypothetical protein
MSKISALFILRSARRAVNPNGFTQPKKFSVGANTYQKYLSLRAAIHHFAGVFPPRWRVC